MKRKRVNVMFPEETLTLVDKVASKGERSAFISRAVNFYVRYLERNALRKGLKEGALVRAKRDLALARSWFALEQELWEKGL